MSLVLGVIVLDEVIWFKVVARSILVIVSMIILGKYTVKK